MNEESPQQNGLSFLLTLLLGTALIVVIAPLSMFLTSMTVNSDMETASPAAWAVGLLFSAVLALLPLRIMAKKRALSRPNLVLLYIMLSVAVPLMNMGLARPLFLSMQASSLEFLYQGTNTYRTTYGRLDKDWAPVSPTMEGVAWLESFKILRELENGNLISKRESALRVAIENINAGKGIGTSDIDAFGLDGLLQLQLKGDAIDSATQALLASRITALQTDSAEAGRSLFEALKGADDLLFSASDSHYANSSVSLRNRIDRSVGAIPVEEKAPFRERLKAFNQNWESYRSLTEKLGNEDRRGLHKALMSHRMTVLEGLDDESYNMHRANVLFRVDRRDRILVMGMDGSNYKGLETPGQNIKGLYDSAWPDTASKRRMENQSFSENLSDLHQLIPWNIWRTPMVNWSLLFIVVVVMMMALAEVLRRKWVDRENLAFPLVDVADSVLRHDAELETSEDPTTPSPRSQWFSGVAITGMLLGAILIIAEAVGWYGYTSDTFVPAFDVSKELFTSGSLRSVRGVQFVLSPIIIGIAFLISLEMSFSIWFTFILYKLITFLVNSGEGGSIRDSLYTGWGGGKNYPFPMEQMLGACLIYSLILLWNTRGSGPDKGGSFFPKKMASWAVWICLGILGFCFWDQGIQHVGLIALFLLCVMMQTIAAARVRAETGLPGQHVNYEYTKLPMIFGMTGSTGKDTFASYINIVFLPVTLLFRLLPQHLENIELARRHRLGYGKIAIGSILASVVAIFVGVFTFIYFAYFHGWDHALATYPVDGLGNPGPKGVAHYPLWVSHFLSEQGLDKYVQVHHVRVIAIIVGAAVVGMIIFARKRWLRFPLHPAGYLLLLLSMNYEWTTSYLKGNNGNSESTIIWGSVLMAWIIKKLIINYGGMTGYKKSKPFFIGLIVGSIVCVFAWNMLDLVLSLMHAGMDTETLTESGWLDLIKPFLDKAPFSPKFF